MMALGGTNFMQNSSVLDQLLEEINFQRTKEMRQLMKDESGFVVLQGTTYWTDLFVRHFLFQEDRSIDCDDLLFFVRKKHVKGSSRYLPKYETDVEVFRKDSKKLPIGDPEIDWEETLYLNLVVHRLEYTVTLAVCTRTSPKQLQVLRRRSREVYASPSRRKMDTKGEGEEITYPHICFMVDNFDEVFSEISVRDGEMVCVELVAKGRGTCGGSGRGPVQAVIFLGSIRYDALSSVYNSRQTSLSTKVAQRMSFGLLGRGVESRCEFVRMKGPCGKGHAEMAVSRPHAAGCDTPASEPGLPLTDSDFWDSDWDEDPEEMFVYRHQRRLSDPSANITAWSRGGWRTRDSKDKSRSENEGLDSMFNGIAEVEAGDLRDGREKCGCVASSERWGSCCGCRAKVAGEPYLRSGVTDADSTTPACLQTLSPRRQPRLPPTLRTVRRSEEKRIATQECELADDAGSLDEQALAKDESKLTLRRVDEALTVRGQEELPYCDDDAESDGVGEKAGSEKCDGKSYVPIALRGSNVLLPRRVTPDGTQINYWCDVPRQKSSELDDGAYNPLWASRGFTQTFHLWKEGKRQQSAPLNAYLTYVTLPWWSIAKDILDHREEPILTF